MERGIAAYVQSLRPSATYAAMCSTGDSECAIGDPRTAALGPDQPRPRFFWSS